MKQGLAGAEVREIEMSKFTKAQCIKCHKISTYEKDEICIICKMDAKPVIQDISDFPKHMFTKGKRFKKGVSPFSMHYLGA
jgi:hypothetical protein